MIVDGIAFDRPTTLEDSTSYTFRDPDSTEELSVELELPIGAGCPAAEVLTEIRSGLAGMFAAKFTVLDEGDTTLAGEPARYLRYRLDGDERASAKIVVANIGPQGEGQALRDWVKIAWAGAREADTVDAHVDSLVASLCAAEAASGSAPAGHRRHRAGPWLLDLPAHLLGPRTFIFEDPDVELRVELSILHDDADEPTLDPGSATAGGGEEVARDEHELDDGERVDLQVRSDDDPNGSSQLILAKRRVELRGARAGEHRWVVLSASGPARAGARLIAVVDELLASVHASE